MYLDIEEFSSPFFLLLSSTKCWVCRQTSPVVGLLSGTESSDPFMLSDITTLPEGFLAEIHRIQPNYELRSSRTAGISYYMNICSCGASLGDHYLFCDPGGAFFPLSDEEASKIQIQELPFQGEFHIDCSPGLGVGRQILKQGQRVGAEA